MKDPAMLWYPSDWISGTMGMTFEEKGAYMDLLMMQFNRGHMTSHMVGQVVGQIWDKIKDKFKIDADGLYYNSRVDEEKNKRKVFTDSRKNNLTGTNQHTKKVGHKKGHTTSHMEDININVIIDYFNTNGYTKESAEKFFKYYSEADWKDSKGNKVKNWKQKAQGVWFKPENEIKKEKSKMVY